MKISNLSWFQFFQPRKKFLKVSLLGRGGGDFLGRENGIDIRAGCCNSGVVIGWNQLWRALLMPLRWHGGSVGRVVCLGV